MLKEQVAEILKSKMALEKCDPDVMPYFTDYYWIPKDEVINFAQAIINLFKAEVDKLTGISWERMRMALQEQDKLGQHDNMFRLESIAKAQLQHDKDTLN